MGLETSSFIIYAIAMALIMQSIGVVWLITSPINTLYDKGWAAGRVVTWLFVALPIWFVAHTGLPANSSMGVASITLLLVSLTAYRIFTNKSQIKSFLTRHKSILVLQESLFILGFVFLALTRAYNPHIQDLEKPMDAGFMASYLRSPSLPAADIWLAGETINYYSFGHYLGAILTQLWQLDISFSYNLILAFIFGTVLSLSASIGINLIPLVQKATPPVAIQLLVGLATSMLVAIAGNTHTIWYGISNSGWDGYWYADATRFIHHTIHEFPSYSFVVADIHAHVWNFPLVLLFLLILTNAIKQLLHQKKLLQLSSIPESFKYVFHSSAITIHAIAIGVSIGIFAMTSAWDALIYALLLTILGFILILYRYQYIIPVVYTALTALIAATITAIPWAYHFQSISEGISLVQEHSPWDQFLILWSGHIFMSSIALAFAIYELFQKRTKSPASAICIISVVITGWILLMLPEIIFVKDIYTSHPRANTMFKLTYQAFILLNISAAWTVGYVFQAIKSKSLKALSYLLLGIYILITCTFPYFAYKGYYHYTNFQGLYGYSWLRQQSPTDFSAIMWLEHNASDQAVVLEAVGESYTDYARVSAITGIPTVLGWRVHEWLWRGGFDIPGQRTTEVETMYTKPTSADARQLFDQYHVNYIFIGDKELEAYPNLDLTGLKSLGEVVYANQSTMIIQRQPASQSQ